MKIKIKMLQNYMKQSGLSKEKLAQLMGVSKSEIEKMLIGEAVGQGTASLFIRYFTPDKAHEFIDWKALGKDDPLADSSEPVYINEDCENDYDDSEQDYYSDDYFEDDWDYYSTPFLEDLVNMQEDSF